MPTRSDLRFQAGRIGSVFRLLLKNRMSFIGLLILAFAILSALGSPLLAPASPTAVVSGAIVPPAWVSNFPEGYYLSRNMIAAPHQSFDSPGAVQDWSLNAPQAAQSNVYLAYAQGITIAPSISAGSAQLTYTGSGPATISLSRTFRYPYHGPPQSFHADLAVRFDNSSPVLYTLFVRTSNRSFTIFEQNLTNTNGAWGPLGVGLDSHAQDVSRFVLGNNAVSSLNPAEVIFSSIQDYSFGVEFTFKGPQRVEVSLLQLSLLGTSYGILGTDNDGHDMWSQLIYGSQISLFVGLLAAGIGIGLGLIIGLMAGFLGKFVDELLMRFTDMMLVLPALPLLIVLVGVLGARLINVIIIIGFLGWMGFARIIRSQVLSLRERPFVEAAKAAGSGQMRIITRHIFPNIVSLTYVNLAVAVPAAILTETALAYLGLSDPGVVSWGNIYAHAQQADALALHPPPWWWLIPPGLAIALTSLAFILLGYALDEIFNPKLRRRR